jgi:mannose/fructose/N-acetylgalactosamine-specific phosphotransferase system component IIB
VSVILIRVDQRLLHGQVVEGWVPYLKADGVVVADDRVAADPLSTIALTAACPAKVKLAVLGVADAARVAAEGTFPGKRTLVLGGTVAALERIWGAGFRAESVNLGNVPLCEGRIRITSSVALSRAEVDTLDAIAAGGVPVEARAVPKERAADMAAIHAALAGAGNDH